MSLEGVSLIPQCVNSGYPHGKNAGSSRSPTLPRWLGIALGGANHEFCKANAA
jgi:hypothetical protein